MIEHDLWRILLVEDDQDDYYLVREMLASAHQGKFALTWAASFDKGLAALRAGTFDAVLVDYDLGAYKGTQLIQQAVQSGVSAPMILLTGRGSYEIDLLAMQCGAADYLNKNEINPSFLERSIRFAVENKRIQQALADANARLAHANQELAESEQRFRVALLPVPMFVFAMDKDLRYTWAYNSQLGFRDEEMIGKREEDLFPNAEARHFIDLLRQVIETGQGFQRELFGPNPHGSLHFFVAVEPVFDASGQITGLTGASLNITEQRQMEAQQAEYATRMEVQRRLMQQREMERMDIARDLHDGPLQELTAISFAIAEAVAIDNRDERVARLDTAQEMLMRQAREIRIFCNELRPPALAPFGLEKAIRSHIDTLRERQPNLRFHLNLDQDRQQLPEDTRLALFRILQEVMNNITKHARATNVWVTLTLDREEVTLEVEDDGKGYEVPRDWMEQARSGHLGLLGMRERALAINGAIEFDSTPGRGSRVRVSVPRAQAEPDAEAEAQA